MNETPDSLLATDEPPPFTVDNENGTSPLLIVADHVERHFPRRLGQRVQKRARIIRLPDSENSKANRRTQ
jgi:hypothetical protein